MNRNGEARANPGPDAARPTVAIPTAADKPTITVERSRLARWLEAVEAAIDNAPDRVDILCDLAASIEDLWLSPEAGA